MGRANRFKQRCLGEKLFQIRNGLKLNLQEMIDMLDCPEVPLYESSIYQYEKGLREPPLIILLKYSRLANVYLDFLVDDNLRLPEEIPNLANLPQILNLKSLKT